MAKNDSNRMVRGGILLMALFAVAFIVGLVDVLWVKILAGLVLPRLLYILIVRMYGNCQRVHTGLWLMLAVAGVMGVLASNVRIPFNFLLLWGFLLLTGFVGLRMIVKSRYYFGALVLVCGVIIFMIPMILGYWPYAVLKSEKTVRHYPGSTFTIPDGLFLICNNGKWGLRDRFRMILDTDYDEISQLSPSTERYVLAVEHTDNGGNDGLPVRYTVYDTELRCKAIDPDKLRVGQLKVDPSERDVFNLIDDNGRHCANFRLTIVDDSYGFSDEATFEPHYSDSVIPLETFIRKGCEANVDRHDDDVFACMLKNETNKDMTSAVTLLKRIGAMGALPSSASNDRVFGEAVRHFIDEDPHYEGNTVMAFTEMESLLDWRNIYNGCFDHKFYGKYISLLYTVKLSWTYYDLTADHLIVNSEEYQTWHDFMEAFVDYYDYFRKTSPQYHKKEMHDGLLKAMWMRDHAEKVNTDHAIFMGIHSTPISTEGLKTADDVEEIFLKYQSDERPYGYHPVWNEMRPAFRRWIAAREAAAKYLENRHNDSSADSYRSNTAAITDQVYKMLEVLTVTFDPVYIENLCY